MGVVVSLKDVVDAMDVPNDDWTSYVNPKTGEIVTVTDEDRQLVEDEDPRRSDVAGMAAREPTQRARGVGI